MIWQAVHAGFDYFQREAGYTRTGSHNTRVHGRETGQWHEADLAVAHWLQHTSRDGDMQLHVHSQIAHVAQTATDGKWRAPDSLGYNEHIGAVAAIVSQHLEEALTRRFGLEWTARDDGHGFEIKGISGEMMRLFSSRRESITADLRARAAQFEQRYGRAPSQRELAQLAQASNFTTRNPKHGALDLAQAHAGWADKLTHTLGVPLASIAPSVWHESRTRNHARHNLAWPGPDRGRAGARGSEGGRAGPAGKVRVDARRRDQAPGPGAAPDRDEPGRGRRAPGGPNGPGAASQFEPVVCLEAPSWPRFRQLAARGRPQRLPAARRRTVRDARAARHGGAHARASPRGHRAEAGARAGRAGTDRRFVFKNHEDAELGYAVTDHAAQGRTVHTALAVITGTEDRQHAYVALTRGTDANHAYVFTASPKRADPVPGPGQLPNWPGTTRFMPNGPASPLPPPLLPNRARR